MSERAAFVRRICEQPADAAVSAQAAPARMPIPVRMTTRVELPQVSFCTGCGDCCRSIGLPPFEVPNPDLGPQPVTPASDWSADVLLTDMAIFDAMPAHLRAAHALLVVDLETDPSGKPCAWLDPTTGECVNYEWRPAACREFTPGTRECLHIRHRGGECVWFNGSTVENWRNPRSPRAERNVVPALATAPAVGEPL